MSLFSSLTVRFRKWRRSRPSSLASSSTTENTPSQSDLTTTPSSPSSRCSLHNSSTHTDQDVSTTSTKPLPKETPNEAFKPQPHIPAHEDTTTFLYEDINPPPGYFAALQSHRRSHPPPIHSPQALRTKPPRTGRMRTNSTPTPNPISMLPGYNDVSGAVIVDWNGLPHFLSPREEEERKRRLECAVRERMLGLSRRTEFTWETPSHGNTLPRYTPGRMLRCLG